MRPNNSLLTLILLAVVLTFQSLAAPISLAQVATGTPSFGSFSGGPDTINLANLNSHLDIPVVNKAGRGTNFTYDLSYDSSVWYPVGVSGSQSWQPVSNWGWRAITEAATGYVTSKSHTEYCANPNPPPSNIRSFYTDTYVYHDAFGSPHPFNVTVQSATCGGGAEWGVAQDGSGYTISFDISGNGVFWLTSSSGTLIIPAQTGSASKTDRNGNVFSVNSSGQFFDTLSSTTPVLIVTGSGTPTSPLVFTYTAPSGAAASYKANYTNYTVATNFGVSGIIEYKSTAAMPLVTSIALPDGTQYSIQYEATPSTPSIGACTPYAGTTCTTARVTSITLPTGGFITYSYSGGNNGILPDGGTATLTRATPDGTWKYTRTAETSPASVTKVTDPQNNDTLIQFQGIYETQRDIYQGAAPSFSTFPIPESTLQTGNLMREIQTCYNTGTTACTNTAITLPITQRTITTQLSGASSWASAQTSRHIYKYGSTGSLTEQDDYDYGIGTAGALLKKTAITYASLTNITGFPQQITVTNGSGTVVSQTKYNYGDTVTAISGTLSTLRRPVLGATY